MLFELLDNGVELVVDRRAYSTVGIALVVKRGYVHEPRDVKGITHMIEHMLFKSRKDLDYVLESIGADVDAETYRDYLVVYGECVPESAKDVVDLLHEMFVVRDWSEEDFAREKRVVLSEIRMLRDDPSSLASELGLEHALGTNYGGFVEGREEVIRELELRDLLEYKSRIFTAENTSIVVVGNVGEDLVEYLRRKFSDVEPGGGGEANPEVSSKGDAVLHVDGVSSAYISRTWYGRIRPNLKTLVGLALLEFHTVVGMGYAGSFGDRKVH